MHYQKAESALYTLIITRPKKQSEAWIDYLIQHHVDYLCFPTLEIKSLHTTWNAHQHEILAKADILIITSANCIHSASPALLQQLQQAAFKIVTLGQGTSNALKQHGIQPFLTAPDGTTSESLLALAFFQPEKMKNKRIVILSGQGGRRYLDENLQQRHAQVHRIALYQRVCPLDDASETIEAIRRCSKPIFVITSQEALINIIQLFPEAALSWLKAQLFIVVSERILQYAKSLSFGKVWNVQSLAIDKIHALIEAEPLSV
ncbi:uroporphyrinogen-III synthase [Candidatus Berkiella cookevillensis]|uniref:Uroporphyrinogen-III synthase n=1 Tax=Candidatus Berkiella cookevillensis TaxID=437022 RepID=A0A0Q9YE55_9GAMM|nr:uroporphyrinogen-III synthase [Candidatus Berkiella cookevillensis]MCS5709681.1 uroporphyrinogen-III synthase [Candidatus Berkiella cookevillensis]